MFCSSFIQFSSLFHFTISSWQVWCCVSAFSIAVVNTDLADLPDSWFAFCFPYSVFKRSQRNSFIDFESSIHGRPPQLDECSPGRPHSNTTQKFDNSIIIIGPNVDTGLTMICCSCHLVDLLFEKWITVLMSVSISRCLEPVEAYYFQETWIKSYNVITESRICYTRQENNSYFMATFYKDTVIILDMPTRHKQNLGEHRLGTPRVSIAMFAGESAKC